MAQRAAATKVGRLVLPVIGLALLALALVGTAQADLSADGPGGAITVTSPSSDGQITNQPVFAVEGQLSNPSATLTVNGVAVSVDGAGHFVSLISLAEGVNVVRLTAAQGLARTQLAFAVNLDTVPPALVVFSPSEGDRLPDDRVAVFGQSEIGASVTVNGVPADAHVFDGTFEVRSLALVSSSSSCLQPQTVTVRAADRAGNVASVVRTVLADHCVSHPVLAAPLPTLEVYAGTTQSVPLDLSAFFADDAGPSGLIFSMYVGAGAASAFSVSYAGGELLLDWFDPSFIGPAVVTIVALDRSGETSDPAYLVLVVRPGAGTNGAPSITLPDAAQIEAVPAGGAVSFIVSTSDPDGDAVELSVGGVSAGVKVRSLAALASNPSSYRVTVEAAAGLSAGGLYFVEFVATDGRLASPRATVALRVYDAAGPAGLVLTSPVVPEFAAADLSTYNGATGVWVEVGAARRVGHLYLDAPSASARREVAAGNVDSTYWRFFVPLSDQGGTRRTTVWAADAGLPEQPFSFDLTVVATPAAPRIDALSLSSLQQDDSVGAWASVEWMGSVGALQEAAFEWRVDGQAVSRDAQLRNFPLEPGSHTVELTATTPGGSASSSINVNVEAPPVLPPTRVGPNYALWLGLGLLLAFGFVLAGTEVGMYFLVAGLLGAIIDRQHREKLLSHFVRGRIYQIIEYEPGIHLSELQRKAGTARGACAYHLHSLEKAGLIKTSRDGMYLRFFVTKVQVDPETYALAEGDREILREIEAQPGISDLEIGQKLARSSGAVTRSVQKLSQSGYIEARKDSKGLLCFPRKLPGGRPASEGAPQP